MADSSSYQYDENSETFPFFLLTILLIVTVPWTLKVVYDLLFNNRVISLKESRLKLYGIDKETDKENQSNDLKKIKTLEKLYELQDSKKTDEFKKFESEFIAKQNTKSKTKQIIILTILWTFIAIIYKSINNNSKIFESGIAAFDPYEILGISFSSTEKEIKSAYRKLSVKFHPDKLPAGLNEAEKLSFEENFIRISKAYQALTDEVVKENYLKYGNPDGPQQLSQGIALPKFLIDNGFYSLLMIVAYMAIFMGVIPYFVSKWWSKSSQFNKQNVHVNTSSLIIEKVFNLKKGSVIDHITVLEWLSHAEEFKIICPELNSEDIFEVFMNHINRQPKQNSISEELKFKIIAKTHNLVKFTLVVASCFNHLELSIAIINTMKSLAQAINTNADKIKYELLQLPGVEKLPELDLSNSLNSIKNLEQFFMLEDDQKLKVAGIEQEDKKQFMTDLKTYTHTVPKLQVLQHKVKVQGQDYVSPGAIIHIELKVLLTGINWVSSQKNQFNQLFNAKEKLNNELEKYEAIEHLLDTHKKMTEQETLLPLVAPKFPVTKDLEYVVLMVGQGKVLQTPIFVNNLNWSDNLTGSNYEKFDKKNFKQLIDEQLKLNKPLQLNVDDISGMKTSYITIPCPTPAPEKPGSYSFKVYLDNTGMFGNDEFVNVSYRVLSEEEIQNVENINVQKRRLAGEIEEDPELSSDSESEEEEEDEKTDESDNNSEYSDINTDTDDE
ncbi:hypothetical protein QEN19_001413 [Hanseniaspora menglaensis]